MRRIAATVALSLALLAPRAASASFIGGVGTYFEDRFFDLMDIARLRVGIPEEGHAIGVKARVTSLAQLGYVHFNGRMYGFERRGVGVTGERRTEGGVSLLYWSESEMVAMCGNSFLRADTPWSQIEDRRILRNLPYWDDGRHRYLSVGAEVETPLIGLDAGVYPEEAIDFVLGWIGIDIFDDDELFLDEQASEYQPTTPRGPDSTAPFHSKREMLEQYDERMKPANESQPQEETEPHPALKKKPLDSGAITDDAANAASKALDAGAATPPPQAPQPTPPAPDATPKQ